MSEKEKLQQECVNDCYQYIAGNLHYWFSELDDFDKSVVVKALINELNNDLVAFLCRIEMRNRGIEP